MGVSQKSKIILIHRTNRKSHITSRRWQLLMVDPISKKRLSPGNVVQISPNIYSLYDIVSGSSLVFAIFYIILQKMPSRKQWKKRRKWSSNIFLFCNLGCVRENTSKCKCSTLGLLKNSHAHCTIYLSHTLGNRYLLPSY